MPVPNEPSPKSHANATTRPSGSDEADASTEMLSLPSSTENSARGGWFGAWTLTDRVTVFDPVASVTVNTIV
jgi:hypothetical protein